MPEFVHTFQNGKMNKDLDERLVPNGQYRDALNLDLANSEGSNVGALQNVKGNVELRSKENDQNGWQANYIEDLSNPVCIGSIRNDIDEKIYWFIASGSVSAIAELDTTTGYIHPILVDKNNILKFSEDYLITGINIIDKFLFWTDDQTEPKRININKFKAGSCDFNTHTKIPEWNPNQDNYTEVNCGFVGATEPDFTEEDVTVIKKSPLTAPILNMATSPFGDNIEGVGILPITTTVGTPISGGGADFENFTYIPDTVLAGSVYESLPTYAEYQQNIAENPGYYANSNLPAGWDGRVTFTLDSIYGTDPETGLPVWGFDDIILLSGSFINDYNETFEYQVRIKIHQANNLQIIGEIQAISTDILKFQDGDGDLLLIEWECILEEKDPMFEYVFPRFAYRWKYIDNEYSTFSPFSEPAFLGNKFKYVSSDGYNIGMTNNIRKLIVTSLSPGSEEVDEIEILYKESHNTAVYSVDSIKKKDFTPYNATAGSLPSIFEIKSEIIGSIIQNNQILRPWDNVPRMAKSQEIVGNRLIYANYLQNYKVDPTLDLSVSIQNNDHQSLNPGLTESERERLLRTPEPSLKTIRTYQAGVLFKDEYGRETPVFTNKNASIKLEVEDAHRINKLSITPISNAPVNFATHYKFFIKETSNEYYNLALDRFYFAEDGNVWLSFPSSERNKVDEETYLILKKQHDNNVFIDNLVRYKILSIKNEAPDYIKTSNKIVASGFVTIVDGFFVDSLFLEFSTASTQFDATGLFNSDKRIRIISGGNRTEFYQLAGGGEISAGSNNFRVSLELPLGADSLFLDGLTSATLEITSPEEENRPEFEGRFFAKINRDFAFDTNIVASFAALEERYGIVGVQDFKGRLANSNSTGESGRWGMFYQDPGESGGSWVCNSLQSEKKQKGFGAWGGNGSHYGDPFDKYRPPTNGSRWVGMIRVGIGNGSFVSKEFGTAGGQVDGLLTTGAFIRFESTLTGEYSGVYKVSRAFKRYGHRGKMVVNGNGTVDCGSEEVNGNHASALLLYLDRPVQESFIPTADGDTSTLSQHLPNIQILNKVIDENNKLLTSVNPAIFETEPKEAIDLDLYYQASDALPIAQYNSTKTLDYYNCYSYGTGVETYRIRDDFNANKIDKGPIVSAPLDEPYSAERKGNGLIFSQIFNSTSGINRLNQFIQAEPITKDLNPTYGTIQKLHTRQTDLLSLCEDKVVKILANKDALFNADGNVNLTGNTAVLGQAMVPATFGEFGISKNPESFAADNYRIYFADKNRGAVLRLSMNGIVNIAGKGMTDFFADNLKVSNKIVGSFDKEKDLYNLTLDALSQQWQNTFNTSQTYQLNPDCNAGSITASLEGTTISFKEMIDGWTSRKSFIPESGISLNNLYYTFKDGRIYEHGLNVAANNFYRVQYESSLNLLINEQPNIVKGYSTINYTGTRSRRLEYQHNQKFYSIAEINALQVIPTSAQQKTPGWYVNYIKTDLEGGEVKEFEKKEGKYFNYIKGLEIFNDCDFIGDGIDNPDIIDADPQNYILTFTIDPTCSDTGGTAPDTMQYFVNIWAGRKALANNTIDLDIEPITSSAQDVKCAIENFYTSITPFQNYAQVINTGTMFSYVFSDSLQVGTQMYNHLTNEPIAQAGAYLFVDTPADQTSDIVNHAGLDANNPIAVPTSYYVMILGADGKIVSYTQYNTLNPCVGDPEKAVYTFSNYSSSKFPFETPNVAVITHYNPTIGGTSTDAQLICAHKNAFSEYFANALPGCSPPSGAEPCKTASGIGSLGYYYSAAQGGSDTIAVGTQLYGYSASQGQYIPAFPNGYVGIVDITNYNNNLILPGRVGTTFTPQSFWDNVATLDNKWKIIRIDSNGVITHLDQINQIPNPTCP